MRILILFSRLVGSLFIVSGLIKAKDPLGFAYKLEEYFAESALNLPFLEPFSLVLGALACIAEVVLGFAVLFGGRMKLATWALLLLRLFFHDATLVDAGEAVDEIVQRSAVIATPCGYCAGCCRKRQSSRLCS